MIRVLHLRSSPFLGSPEKLLLGRLDTLDKSKCIYFFGIFDEQRGNRNDFNDRLSRLDNPGMLLHDSMIFFFINLYKILCLIAQKKISLICTHDYKSNFYGLICSKLVRKPVIAVFHGRTSTNFKSIVYEKIDDFIQSYFNAIIAVSRYTANYVIHPRLKSKIKVIPNAVKINHILNSTKINKIKKEIGLTNKDYIVLYAGRLSREKGVDFLIGAAEKICRHWESIKIIILGNGPERSELEKKVDDKKLRHNVLFAGYRNNIEDFFNMMDVLVLPSKSEGMPLSILEAFAQKKPVIATHVGGVPEVVADSYNGLLVESQNVDALANAIEYLYLNPAIALKMGLNGYKIILKNFNFFNQAEHYLSVYQWVLTNRN